MKFKILGIEIIIEKIFFIIFLISLLFIKAKTFLSNYYICYFFILFHEASHVFMACLFGNDLSKINIKLCGTEASILFLQNSAIKKFLIYLAGPVSNIVLASIFKHIPLVFEINLCLAFINLVPLFPLDGYRLIECLIEGKNNKKKMLLLLNNIVIIIMLILGIFVAIKYHNISIIILIIYIKFMQLMTCDT